MRSQGTPGVFKKLKRAKGTAVPKSSKSFAFGVMSMTSSPNSPTRRRGPRIAALALAALLILGVAIAGAVITQKDNLRLTLTGKISPHTLPRKGVAPIAVSVSGQVTTIDETLPPQLKVLTIDINRNGQFDYQGLPVCSYHQIQPSTNSRALSACRQALVGEGTFSAYIVLKGQEPYATTGRLLIFNGREHGKQVLLGHIYIVQPFSSSFILTFDVTNHRHSTFGTTLTANLAKALGTRRYLTGIDMTLQRRYSYRGTRHSYLSSGCPAPKGFHSTLFPLVRTTFSFAGGKTLASTLTSTCGARG
jgi:hypothetical protein